MEEKSRIRFNPVTKEVEIEGSETFVRTYFNRIQKLLTPVDQTRQKPAARKTVKDRKKNGRKQARGKTQMETVVGVIRGSKAGMTTAALKHKTGLTERQIWGIVYRAEKKGEIKKTKRGIYVGA